MKPREPKAWLRAPRNRARAFDAPRVRSNELHCACAVNFPKNVKRSSAPPPKFLLLATRLMFNAERLSINNRDRDSMDFRTLYSAVWTLSLVTTAVGWPGPGRSAFVSRTGGQERRPTCGVASGCFERCAALQCLKKSSPRVFWQKNTAD